jgi:hypothetical protein
MSTFALSSPSLTSSPDGSTDVLTAEQVDSWREKGFALVDNVIPDTLLNSIVDYAHSIYPAPGSEAAAATNAGIGSGERVVFPSQGSAAFNDIVLHPRLLRAVGQLLNESEDNLRLTQAELWPKYGRPANDNTRDNSEQRVHCDYPNHTLVHPSDWCAPDAVEMILYLSDVEECAGATAVVARDGPDDPVYDNGPIYQTPGVGALPWINNREAAESYLEEHAPEVAQLRREHMYPREQLAKYHRGTLLLYRHDTWHRGTPVKPGALRFVLNMTVRRADAEYISCLHNGWCWSMYEKSMFLEKLVARLGVAQRSVLGFPRPGHRYWSRRTLDGVAARYKCLGMDMEPYEAAFAANNKK